MCDSEKQWNRAAPSLCFKARLRADLLIWKWFFYSHANKKTERKKESERFWNSEMAYYFSIQVRFMAGIRLFLQKHICIRLTSTVPSITNETNFAGTKVGTKRIGTVAIDDVTDGWRCAFIGIWNRQTNLRLIVHTVPDSFCVGTKVRGTQWICSSKYLFVRKFFSVLAGRFGKNNMPFEGTYCWQIAALGCLCETSTPPPPPPRPLKGLILPYDHPSKWPVMSGHTSSGKLPSKSGCRL